MEGGGALLRTISSIDLTSISHSCIHIPRHFRPPIVPRPGVDSAQVGYPLPPHHHQRALSPALIAFLVILSLGPALSSEAVAYTATHCLVRQISPTQ